jgi:hypothetical protein
VARERLVSWSDPARGSAGVAGFDEGMDQLAVISHSGLDESSDQLAQESMKIPTAPMTSAQPVIKRSFRPTNPTSTSVPALRIRNMHTECN